MIKKLSILFLLITSLYTPFASAGKAKSNRYSDQKVSFLNGDSVALMPIGFNFPSVHKELDTIQASLSEAIKQHGLAPNFFTFSDEDYELIQYIVNVPYQPEKKKEIREGIMQTTLENTDYKLVIFPSVISRKATASGRKAKWDGVNQQPIIEGSNPIGLSMKGTTFALSLKLDAYTPDGEWLFTSYGGISLHYYLDTVSGEYVLRDNLFNTKKDLKLLNKGVATALHPIKKKYKVK